MAASMRQVCFHLRSLTNRFYFQTATVNYSKFYDYRTFDGRKFPANKGGRDPVTDTPDWSYADGRPGHYTLEQKKKLLKQIEYAKTIETLLQEIDFTVDNHARKVKQREEQTKSTYENQPSEKVPKEYLSRLKSGEKRVKEKLEENKVDEKSGEMEVVDK